MATKSFVGKLSFDTTSDSLNALFAQYGTVVSADVATDRDSGRSRGFGFVEMQEDADAKQAIEALDGKEFEGRTIVVNVAKPREDRPRSHGGGNNYRGGFGRR